MEHSVRRDPLNCISQFNHLLSSREVQAGPAQLYYERIGVILKLIKPVVEEIVHSELALNEKLQRRLEELCIYVDDSLKLMENCHPLKSKIYNLLQVGRITEKIHLPAQEICTIRNSLVLSTSLSSKIVDIEQHDFTSQHQVLAVLKEAIEDQGQGSSPSSETIVRIAEFLSLSSSQELLVETVILEKLKLEAEHDNRNAEVALIDQLIGLVSHMHDCLVKIKESQTLDGMLIPADFRCPLSLEPMRDPVILASGQTYERAFIRKWIDMGLTVCPKTRQSLVHTNLTPNIAVKQLIGNWCELNNVKFPDPSNDVKLKKLSKLADVEHLPTSVCPPTIPSAKSSESVALASSVDHNFPNESSLAYPIESFSYQSGLHRVSGINSTSGPSAAILNVQDESEDEGKSFPVRNEDVTPDSDGLTETYDHPNVISNEKAYLQNGSVGEEIEGHRCSTTESSATFSNRPQSESEKPIEINDTAINNRNVPSGVTAEIPASGQVLDIQTGSQALWRKPFQWNVVSKNTLSPALSYIPNWSEIEAEVQKLVQDLQSSSPEVQRSAAIGLRLLARENIENRIIIANAGAIKLLVNLLYSTDMETQENAVTALLNLSINDNNKAIIADSGAIEPLINVLKVGNAEAKENSAATLFSLSVTGESKIKIGRSGAIQPLIDLLGNGTPRGKRDAATALYNLSTCPENKPRIVQAGAVKHLIELMDPAAGMIDKAVAVLSNLATISEGHNAIGQQGGIPVLVEVVELGSSRAKERAAAALLQLCNNSHKFSNMAREGVVPPLVALTQFGTARAKEKDSVTLYLFAQKYLAYHCLNFNCSREEYESVPWSMFGDTFTYYGLLGGPFSTLGDSL